MFSFNRVHIIGYQTQPVAVRQTPGGTPVTDLNMVVPYRFQTNSGELLDGKGFHTVTLWGPMADIAGKFVRPGSQLFIAGRLQTDSWDDAQTGEKRSRTKIVGLDMILLDPRDGLLHAPQGARSLINAVNRADIIGNVTRDPELRTTTSGQQVLSIGVATNERWKDKSTGEDRERAEFHSIVIWGALAEETTRVLRKGSRVFASGRVQTRSWETKEGQKRYTTEIIAETILLLGTKNSLIESSIQATSLASDVASQEAASSAFGQPSASGAASSSQSQGEVTEPLAVAGQPAGAPADLPVPEIQYASEVKVEDLPF